MPGIEEFARAYEGKNGALELRQEFDRTRNGEPYILGLAESFIKAAREGMLESDRYRWGGTLGRDRDETPFTNYPLEAGGILLGSLVLELNCVIVDKTFSLKTVVNRFNNALTATSVPNLELFGDEKDIEVIPQDIFEKLTADVYHDQTFTRALSTVYGLSNLHKFLERNKAFQSLHLAKQIWFPLATDVLDWNPPLSTSGIPEFDGPPDPVKTVEPKQLKEGKVEEIDERNEALMALGLTDAEIEEVGGFTIEQVKMFLKLRRIPPLSS